MTPVFSLAQGSVNERAAALAQAFHHVRAGDWDRASEVGRGAGGYGWDIIEWHRLRAARGSFADYEDFLTRRPDWPGLPLLQKRGEASIPKDADPQRVVDFFALAAPQTGTGALRHAAALRALGRPKDADLALVTAWREFSLNTTEHSAFLYAGGDLLAAHHRARTDMLLWAGRSRQAERMLPLLSEDWQKLTRARIGLRGKKPGIDKLVEAVPAHLADHPGLTYERFNWRARKGRNAGAIELALAQNNSAAGLGEAERWAGWRRSIARAEMRAGRHKHAYRLASSHGLREGSAYADLEWLSGYLSLRFLDNPKRALQHFQNFRAAVYTPISLGRAGYWQGRAFEAMKDKDGARRAYTEGARYQTSFYGLLAAEKAGVPMMPTMTGGEQFPTWESAAFLGSSVLKASLLLYKAGERNLAERFMVHLGEVLTREELGQLGDLALAIRDPHIAVMIGKQAARQGHTIERSYYALHPLARSELKVAPELALSIARRESEFDFSVVSGAGARGMMQVMPATAKEVAGKLSIRYEKDRLLTDWDYNVRIGSAFLAQLEARYGKNPILVAAAYNAGPSRADRWMRERGDPRLGKIDVVDWIEHIPFRETRNYVMRVAESLPVYRARVTGKTEPIRLSQELTAR